MQTIDIDALRQSFLEAPESTSTRVLAIALSSVLLVTVLILVRRRTLRAEYTPLWVAVAVVTTAVSLRLDVLRAVTRAIGAWTPSSTIFFLGEAFLLAIALAYSVRLSQHGAKLKTLAQEAAVLRAELDKVRTELRELHSTSST